MESEIDAYSEDEEENEIDLNEMEYNDVYDAGVFPEDEVQDVDVPLEFTPPALPTPDSEDDVLSHECIYLIFLFGVCLISSFILYLLRDRWQVVEVLDGKEIYVEDVELDKKNKSAKTIKTPNAPRMPRRVAESTQDYL